MCTTSQTQATAAEEPTHIDNERTYVFDAKQVFTQETLEDMRDLLALTDKDMSMRQFAAIIDHCIKVTLTLGVATNGFRYIKLSQDFERERRAENGNDGPEMRFRFHEFTPAIQSILIDHLNDGQLVRGSNLEFFLRYQMAVEDLDVQVEWGTCAVDNYECIVPSRKQVLYHYHDWYVLPATEDSDEEDSDEEDDGEEDDEEDDDEEDDE